MVLENTNARGTPRDLDLTEFKERLNFELGRLKRGFQNIYEKTSSMSQKEVLGMDSAYDQHHGDMGTETFERGKDLGLKDGLGTAITKINNALNRIERGQYGYCLECKQPIPIERLRAAPEVELCVSCQEKVEGLSPGENLL